VYSLFIHAVCNGWEGRGSRGVGGGNQGPPTDKQLPPSTFTGQFLRKADI